ncbi:major capsid protein [Microviridae sp.]|nr:major capsid protein [Microviridae sp.]
MHLRTDTTQSNAHFAKAPSIQAPRSGFSIAKKHVTTMQFDLLYPLFTKFIYPGDTIAGSMEVATRLTTQVSYLYDDLYMDLHAWFVPMRLIQTNWSRYQFNAQPGGPTQDNSSLTSPKVNFADLVAGKYGDKSLYDYLGYLTQYDFSARTQHHNNYIARGYNLIWNEAYRDQNLQDPVQVDLDDGPDNPLQYVLLKRGKRHDKFTSCLPWPQKGQTDVGVSVAMSGSPLVTRVPNALAWKAYVDGTDTGSASGTAVTTNGTFQIQQANIISLDPVGGLTVNLGQGLASFLVDDLRYSVSVKHLLEADARGGTRDVESIQNRWNVTVPDFRLQRPEYLGGATFTLDGNIVPQTSETGTTPQATLTSFSQGMSGLNVNHSFVEHGVMMILASARSNITYQFGMRRELQYNTRFDWYQPEFANIGEVAVLNKEIYAGSVDSVADDIFGYQEYGYELRYEENMVTGEMRSAYALSRDNKHMADDYTAGVPALDDQWIQSDTPIERNITVDTATADPLEVNSLFRGKAVRVIPMYSIPGLTRL